MDKKTVLCFAGKSGSGKSTFIKDVLPKDQFYNLKSATTRPRRIDYEDDSKSEQDGREYYFRDESYFETTKFATKLFVNERFWKPGQPKWLYGVPEFEIFDHIGSNFTYDVIQPKYVRQMIDWFRMKTLDKNYNFKIVWFLPLDNTTDIIKKRQNMPNDVQVRKENTCDIKDFENAHLVPDFVIKRILPTGYEIHPYSEPTTNYSVADFLQKLNIPQK